VVHTGREDEYRVPEIMQMIDAYKAKHRPITQLAALHELLKIADEVLSKKQGKEKEKREEKEVSSAA
jgi:hypothetical protein